MRRAKTVPEIDDGCCETCGDLLCGDCGQCLEQETEWCMAASCQCHLRKCVCGAGFTSGVKCLACARWLCPNEACEGMSAS